MTRILVILCPADAACKDVKIQTSSKKTPRGAKGLKPDVCEVERLAIARHITQSRAIATTLRHILTLVKATFGLAMELA